MEIKYNGEKRLILQIEETECKFKEDNEKIIKLLTDPSRNLVGEVQISSEIDSEPDLTYAMNYKKFINEFLLERVVYNDW